MTDAQPASPAPTPSRYIPVLALAYIRESKGNPRKNFKAEKLEELAASIKEKGVLEPILVRPDGDGQFELVFGHRRVRAAAMAGLDAVPATVRDLTDTEVLEIQVVENLQRDDLHELEEAEGYARLAKAKGYNVARIAEKIGRSVKYVYDRMKLTQLTPEIKDHFLGGHITAGHAILLARLTTADQKRCLGGANPSFYYKGGLFTPVSHSLWGKDEKKDPMAGLKAVSVRELQAWVDKHVRFDVETVEPLLFPQTATVLAAAREDEERIVPITHDHQVHPDAKDSSTRTYGPTNWKAADKRSCEDSVIGVFVAGPQRGEALRVCIDKKACKTHWAAEMRESKRRASGAGSGRKAEQDRYQKQREANEARYKKEQAERAKFDKAVPAIYQALAEKVKAAAVKPGGLLADLVIAGVQSHRATSKAAEKYIARGKTLEDLVRHAAFIELLTHADSYRQDSLTQRAKAFGIDVRKIVDEVSPPEKPAAAAPAKKAGGKK